MDVRSFQSKDWVWRSSGEREYKVWGKFGVEERKCKENRCGTMYEFCN